MTPYPPPCFWTNSEFAPLTKILLEGINIQGFRVIGKINFTKELASRFHFNLYIK
jgi:hypothetical protein